MNEPREPMLSLRGLSKSFAANAIALDGVNLDVAEGEFVSLVGSSGCGKSTVLRIAAGLETATGGTCTVKTANIGFVFQDSTLLPWRNVKRNIDLLLELHDVSKSERDRRTSEIISVVGLEGSELKYPRQLSGGMRMRTSLARSLVTAPELFLFDEPFGALDELTRERLNDELLAIYALQRFAALFVTHSIAEAVYLSSRVAVMTPQPGSIAAIVDVPFAYPREHSIRYTPQFAAVCGQVSSALRLEVARP